MVWKQRMIWIHMLVFKNEIITHEFIYGARKDLIDLHWTELLYTWGLPQRRRRRRHRQKSTRTDQGYCPP